MTDLGNGLYLGRYEGGLYCGGLNHPPASHQLAIQQAANAVVPRDQNGMPSTEGLIGFASITMSNANQEWSAFKQLADQDDHRNSRVRLITGAAGGQSMDVIRDPNAQYWTDLAVKIDAAGMTSEQVQVVWLKMADAEPSTLSFPMHALHLKTHAREVLHILKATYPNLALAYFSSRSYGGYASAPNRSEPLSYETGFATKWLIDEQIAGDVTLNYNPSNGTVVAPVILWGPYLWTNGLNPRNDGLIWERTDVENDAVHPSPSGELKVALMLNDYFNNAPSSTPWYSQPAEERLVFLDASDDAWVDAANPTQNFGSEQQLLVQPGRRHSYFKFDLRKVTGKVRHAELVFNTHPDVRSSVGVQLRSAASSNWHENQINFNNAPFLHGTPLATFPELSRGSTVSVDVTDQVNSASTPRLTFALVGGPGSLSIKVLQSKEGGDGPRLVLTMLPEDDDPGVPFCRNLPNCTGVPGLLDLTGSSSVGQNNLSLEASQLPPNERAVFFIGLEPQRKPYGDGFLCIANPIVHTSTYVLINQTGRASMNLNIGSLFTLVGRSLYAQCAYQDAAALNSGFNFTNGQRFRLSP
ncbi:MAG: DNRLRE domain-containing protein [Planctomycetes bacterium]|nr:DNRLRE domain-containing protein [Planctomycetota bacterium]MCP4862209.1 DNRLRE domain-containing protein [Planctomycetota bacterium]